MLKNFFVSILILILLGISVFVGANTYRSKEKTIEYGGLERKYRIHLPKDYKEGESYPLVFAFHGFLDNPRLLELFSGLSYKADRESYIIVYPYGTKGKVISAYSWNAKFCCGYAHENDIDDVGFVSFLIDEISEKYSVDSSRVYLTGFSNGAMFVNYAATQLADKIAAAAPVASAIGGMKEDEEEFIYLEKTYKPVPVLIIHGREDNTVPFNGGTSNYKIVEFSGAYDVVNYWLENNQCNKHPLEISKTDHFSKEIYNQCADTSEVVFYAVNSDHTWPGGLYELTKNISGRSTKATDLIWEFFSKH